MGLDGCKERAAVGRALGAVKPIGRRAVAGKLDVLVRLTEHEVHNGVKPVHRVRRKQHEL